ncbi:helix-turn-helix domain-containing protein [Mariniphaga sp.]|uniref:helix-turn-helix domain-containing protein n=1 Tax=Mariniphaga sp. TaxID=1954475 RepID=UPI00356AF86E
MAVNTHEDQALLKRLTAIVEANLSDEHFGVNELAQKTGLSRSHIHRRLKSISNKSLSQFIREVRLEKAKELLEEGNLTGSEIAYKVGFGSPSYFIKSFHDYFGYPPGKIGSGKADIKKPGRDKISYNANRWIIITSAIFVLVFALFFIQVFNPFFFKKSGPKISIAVLPASCELSDSCQFNVLNQIIQNVINNLSLVNEIDPKPWPSLRQYLNSDKPIPKITQELHVKYIVETQVFNVFNGEIQLNVNLIEGNKNTQLSTNSVNLDYSNAQIAVQDFTKVLLKQLNVKMTPLVYERITRIITNNPIALQFYWDGMDSFNQWFWHKESQTDKLKQAIYLFEKALKYDNHFALANAQMAVSYYKLKETGIDVESFSEKIELHSKRAFSLDSLNDICMIAKAYACLNKGDNELAISYFEQALKYNPNSLMALRELNRIYEASMGISPFRNNEKQLEYALRVIHSEIPENSRVGITKYDYVNLAVAFRHSGFLEEALIYINKAIEIDTNYAMGIAHKSQIVTDLKGYQHSIMLLNESIEKDSTNLFVKDWLWLTYYMLHDFETAYRYLMKFGGMPASGSFFGRASLMLKERKEDEKAQEFLEKYFEYAKSIKGPIKSFHLSQYYFLIGDSKNAIEQLKTFSKEENYPNWIIRVIEDDPINDNFRNLPEFKRILKKIKKRFRKNHEKIKDNLEKKGLLLASGV